MNAAMFTNRETKVWAAERAPGRTAVIPVLVVSPSEDDHRLLRKILKPPAFHLLPARSLLEAEPLIRRAALAAVIASDGGDFSWKDVSRMVRASPATPHPRLIVAAPKPGERLWAEVIRAGGFDVLEKPFDRRDAIWIVTDASDEWLRENAALANTARQNAA